MAQVTSQEISTFICVSRE